MSSWQRTVGGGLAAKTETQQNIFKTAANYQLIHSLALAATPAICGVHKVAAKVAGTFFAAGIVLFSGACYTVVLMDDRTFSKVAPYGGFSLMFGWLSLALLRK